MAKLNKIYLYLLLEIWAKDLTLTVLVPSRGDVVKTVDDDLKR
jgi:hypothetical protein